MIKYALPWLIGIQMLMLTTAQYAGTFIWIHRNVINVTFVVSESGEAGIFVSVILERTFADGVYPLVKVPGSNYSYEVNFPSVSGGVKYWHQVICTMIHGIPFRPNDLKYLNYTSPDSMAVHFAGHKLVLRRVGFDMTPGRYVFSYPRDVRLKLGLDVGADDVVSMVFTCASSVGFLDSFKYLKSNASGFQQYVLKPDQAQRMNQTLTQLSRECPELKFKIGVDLTYLISVTSGLLVTSLLGNREVITRLV